MKSYYRFIQSKLDEKPKHSNRFFSRHWVIFFSLFKSLMKGLWSVVSLKPVQSLFVVHEFPWKKKKTRRYPKTKTLPIFNVRIIGYKKKILFLADRSLSFSECALEANKYHFWVGKARKKRSPNWPKCAWNPPFWRFFMLPFTAQNNWWIHGL